MRTTTFGIDGLYHIYNRGVEKRKIFLTRNDYLRFLQCIYELNDTHLVINLGRRSFLECTRRASQVEQRKPIVSLVSFVLMPNHFHLLLQPRAATGIQNFMHRLGVSYAKYFNRRIGRTGRLFESTFKAKEITNNTYLQHIVRYHHLNPLSLFQKDWKEKGIRDKSAASRFLDSYFWSSYMTYLGKKGAEFLIDKQLAHDIIQDHDESHREFVLSWGQRDMQTIFSHLSET